MFFLIQPTVQEHEELVWLSMNLKLEVTEYSMWLYGPRGYAHSGDDDDDVGDSETTLSVQPRNIHKHTNIAYLLLILFLLILLACIFLYI